MLIPYIGISFIWVIPTTVYFYKYSIKEIFIKFILAQEPAHLWFLIMLFWVYILANYISDIIKESEWISIGCFGVSFLIGILGKGFSVNIFQFWTGLMYFPFFILGFKIRQYDKCIIRRIPGIVYCLIQLIFLYICFIDVKVGMVSSIVNIIMNFILHINGAIMAFVLLQEISFGKDLSLVKILEKCSMAIYLVHQPIIYILLKTTNWITDAYIRVLLIFVGTMLFAVVISLILKRNKVGRIIVGEWK